jgi:A/G-specific adenine glycosylase
VAHERALWSLATDLLPLDDMAQAMPRYTQGVMDLGATLCMARQPQCPRCPLADLCVARAQGQPQRYPVKTRKLKRSAQSLWLLWARSEDGQVWLSQRPTPGVWAGLYCLPLFDSPDELAAALPEPQRSSLQPGAVLRHVLTHKDLYLHPVQLQLPQALPLGLAGGWVAAARWPALGLPAPIRKWLAPA